MRVVWSWLREMADLARDVAPDEAAAVLTGAGLEVESLERIGGDFSGVVIAEVVGKRPHPKADRLTVVDVIDEAGGTATEVVCGAPNVPAAGGRVLWARPGARLPGGIEIGRKALKGVESAGMLCSETELKIGDDGDGIIVLAGAEANLALGADAAEALGPGDVVIDVSAPANRPDVLGHIGIARELVALCGGTLRMPDDRLDDLTDRALDTAKLVAVAIDDPDGCPRYTARVIDRVKVGPSPRWMQQRLRAVGVRPLSNLVDVSNYVMFELGQPLHAFDAAHVRGNAIRVRRARAGERMKTLDNIERQLEPGDILICDAERPVALGGVMGGLDSEVTDTTARVLLESAGFDPRSIRRTARRLGLHSESSARFERGVDAASSHRASARAARLMAELGGGVVAAGMVDAYPRPAGSRKVALRLSRTTQLLGFEIPREQTIDLLARLSLEVSPATTDPDRLEVSCPTFRPDLTREVDLIEEVLRHYGYGNVPATLPPLTAPPVMAVDPRPAVARRALVNAGMAEAITFGFTSPDRIAALRLPSGDRRGQPLPLRNPMTVEQSVMRTSLLPNLLAAVRRNQSFGVAEIRLFEIGSVFLRTRDGELPDEPTYVTGVACGTRAGWLTDGGVLDFFDVKGMVERLLRELGVAARFIAAQRAHFHPGVCAEVVTDAGSVGEVGQIHPEVARAFEIEGPCFGFDIAIDRLPVPATRTMSPIPRYPATVRDVSFFVSDTVPAAQVGDLIASAGEPLLESFRVLEDYREPGRVPDGQKGMLWSITYRSSERTLTDEEADRAHEAIVARLIQSLSATRR